MLVPNTPQHEPIGSSDKTDAEINYNLRAHTAHGYRCKHLPKRHFGSDPQIPLSEKANVEDIELTFAFVDQGKSRPGIINEQLMRWFVISHRAPSRYANTGHHFEASYE